MTARILALSLLITLCGSEDLSSASIAMPDQLMMDTQFASAKISVGSDISYGASSPDLITLNSAEERNYQQVTFNLLQTQFRLNVLILRVCKISMWTPRTNRTPLILSITTTIR